MRKEVLHTTLYAIGVKNRCRKAERHSFPLGDFALDVPLEELRVLALSKIRSDMKTCTGANLVTQPHTLVTDEGFTTREFAIYQGMHSYVVDL